MSLSSKTELARALFRTPSPDSVTRISGTATADSSDGTVTVQLEDGDVIEVGTIGSVSAGDTVTIHVQRGEAQVIASEGWGDAMQAAVDEATAIAEATGQHFWHDSNGAHVTEVTADQWAQSQTGHNILVNSLGILLRRALNYIAAWTGSALSFYDGNGNAASNVTASFGSAGAQIGKVDESHLEMDYHSMRMVAFDGTEYFRVADVRDYDGTITATVVGDGVTTQWALPSGNVYSWHFSAQVLDEHGNPPGISYSFAVIQGSTTFSYIFQVTPVMAAGYTCTVTFRDITAPSPYLTFGTRGSGDAGFTSATFGYNLVATSACSLVTGTYNVPDENGEHAVIVGNGINQSARSNALTVDWSGNVEAAGDVSGATLSSAGGLSLYGGTAFEDMFSCTRVSTTIGTIAGSSTKTLTISAARDGYKPIAISGWYIYGAATLHPYRLELSGTNVECYLRNNLTSATSASAVIYVQVLYIKTTA